MLVHHANESPKTRISESKGDGRFAVGLQKPFSSTVIVLVVPDAVLVVTGVKGFRIRKGGPPSSRSTRIVLLRVGNSLRSAISALIIGSNRVNRAKGIIPGSALSEISPRMEVIKTMMDIVQVTL